MFEDEKSSCCAKMYCISYTSPTISFLSQGNNTFEVERLCVVVYDYVFHNSSNVTHLYIPFSRDNTILLNVMEGTHKICYPPTFVCPNNIHSAHAAITSFNIVDSDGVPISLHS